MNFLFLQQSNRKGFQNTLWRGVYTGDEFSQYENPSEEWITFLS